LRVFYPGTDNLGLVHALDRIKTDTRTFMWDKMKDWLLHGAIETDEKKGGRPGGTGYHVNRSKLLVLESKADMQELSGPIRLLDDRAVLASYGFAVWARRHIRFPLGPPFRAAVIRSG
jgi:hypothetical protein